MELGFSSSMKTHYTTDVKIENVGKIILLAGWVLAKRDKGKIIFLKIRDARGSCQIVFKRENIGEGLWEKALSLTPESVLSISGKIIEEKRSKTGVELVPENIIIYRIAERLPVDLTGKKVSTDLDTLFKHREITIRRQDIVAVMKIKSTIAKAVREFYHNNGFFEIWTPYILGTSTEGGAAMFKVDYFDEPALLAQSSQFYKQAAIAMHEKVYGILPSWRAEKSRTPKHVTEFHQIETEIAFGDDQTIMEIQENLVVYVCKEVKKNNKEDLDLLKSDFDIPELPFKRIPFFEAKKLATELVKNNLGIDEPEGDFSTPAETELSKHFKDPFFVTEFPTELRGIYYDSLDDKPEITGSLDLIAPNGIGELSSGGKRVSDPDKLIERIKNAGYDVDKFDWYINIFKFGMPPHAGFGLGFERLVRWLTGVKHAKEAAMFPRTPDILSP